MDAETIARLNAINREFYRSTADHFELLRRGLWPGWKRLIPHLQTMADRVPLRVLDVGCGNGRFATFLARHVGVKLRYHGIDSNARLLEHARQALQALQTVEITLEARDIVEAPPDSGEYDLVVAFGVLHHIPGGAARCSLLHGLAQRLAPGGLLAFACWRFAEYERYTQRFVKWPDDLHVEANDYLLDWQRGVPALRYCHYVDDTEQTALVTATGLKETARYRADGETGDVNCYSLLMT